MRGRTGGATERAPSASNSDRSVESAENTRRWRGPPPVADTAALSGAVDARSTARVIWLSRLGVILRGAAGVQTASEAAWFACTSGRHREQTSGGPGNASAGSTLQLAARVVRRGSTIILESKQLWPQPHGVDSLHSAFAARLRLQAERLHRTHVKLRSRGEVMEDPALEAGDPGPLPGSCSRCAT